MSVAFAYDDLHRQFDFTDANGQRFLILDLSDFCGNRSRTAMIFDWSERSGDETLTPIVKDLQRLTAAPPKDAADTIRRLLLLMSVGELRKKNRPYNFLRVGTAPDAALMNLFGEIWGRFDKSNRLYEFLPLNCRLVVENGGGQNLAPVSRIYGDFSQPLLPQKFFDIVIIDDVYAPPVISAALSALRPGGRIIAISTDKAAATKTWARFLPACAKIAVADDCALYTMLTTPARWYELNADPAPRIRLAWQELLMTAERTNLNDRAALDKFIGAVGHFEKMLTDNHRKLHGEDLPTAVNRVKEALTDLRLGFGDVQDAVTLWDNLKKLLLVEDF